jgi:TolA-binding protein
MTHPASRSEELLREMRVCVTPVDAPEVTAARRERTVEHLKALQARNGARKDLARSWRKRLLAVALIAIPTTSLAATLVVRSVLEREGANERRDRAHTVLAPSRGTAPAHRETAPADSASSAAVPSSTPLPSVDPVARAATRVAAKSGGTAASPESTLGEENASLERAMSTARQGNDSDAVRMFGDFLARYPRSPLAQNAEVERFRALARLGNFPAAARGARRYLGEHPEGMARDEARRLAVESAPELSRGPAPR